MLNMLWKLAASNMHHIPEEVYISFAFGSILTATGLYAAGKRDDALFVAVLGAAFASTMGTMKILSTTKTSLTA